MMDSGWYPIDKCRIKNEADLLHWIFHLGDKNWMTKERLLWFAERVCKDKGFRMYGV